MKRKMRWALLIASLASFAVGAAALRLLLWMSNHAVVVRCAGQ